MWEELLKDVTIIKWCVIYMTVCVWAAATYFLFKEIPKWWRSFDKKGKIFTLKQMKKDLAAAERPRTREKPKTQWD